MDKELFERIYWKHYIALEGEFLKTSKYVEISRDNFKTYSIEYYRQYQSICSEVDVVLKLFCKIINGEQRANKINQYAKIILNNRTDFKNIEVKDIINCQINLKPWETWNIVGKKVKNPKWWQYYNRVKHERTSVGKDGEMFFKKANLKNVINSLAALYILERYIYRELCGGSNSCPTVPSIQSNLFNITTEGWMNDILLANGNIWIKP